MGGMSIEASAGGVEEEGIGRKEAWKGGHEKSRVAR